ncbi:hypothetical protein [Micromonospora thermarum]|uniref:hypothetical protein n=1 Tax=Micromonospora thermarum TaxID=2720024 RepID=UPI001F0CE9B0|nr:hypothetical protein [Micromonospora thermarum]
MSTNTPVDWTELAPHLVDAARRDRSWYLTVARELVAPGDRLAGDVGCGAADLDAWDRRLNPADEWWLGHRDDLFRLSARSVHLGARP